MLLRQFRPLPLTLLLCIFASVFLCDTAASHSAGEARVIHVFVALCDNKYQWIAKVPPDLGNGQNPSKNLYWGAMYGLKSYFGKQKDWQPVSRSKPDVPHILERLVFKAAGHNVYLVADAYDGRHIRACIHYFMQASAGLLPSYVKIPGQGKNTILPAGGQAGLLCYVGHNGLMEFSLNQYPQAVNNRKRDAAVFACQSKRYFTSHLQKAGAEQLVLTTGNMAPEAYIVHALANAWTARKSRSETREAVAQAYHKYQKCGLNAARRLFDLKP